MNPPISEITLRDYFATAAMQEFISSTNSNPKDDADVMHIIAGYAYLMADAMMKARDAPKK